MRVIDPGHDYELVKYDEPENRPPYVTHLRFVKRIGDKYPGNTSAYSGTTIQEVCRALIDRCHYVNKQEWCSETEISIRYLRGVILELERRAARRHGRKIIVRHEIEDEPTCRVCGHIQCNETCRPKKAEVRDEKPDGHEQEGTSEAGAADS